METAHSLRPTHSPFEAMCPVAEVCLHFLSEIHQLIIVCVYLVGFVITQSLLLCSLVVEFGDIDEMLS